jgi:protein-tyrosine phosphatase
VSRSDNVRDRSSSPLVGAFNFRDLGGLPLVDGRRTRHGLLFRSDTLQALTPDDLTALRDQIGLRAVVDLRLAREVADEGRGLLGQLGEVRYVNAPLEMASTEGIAPDEVLNRLYLQCLASPTLAAAVARIAEHAGEPTVFHCAAGKDRTGVVAAIVLSLLGVTEAAIVEDYLASAANMPRMVERFMSWPRYRDHLAAMPAAVYAVEPGPILHLLRALSQEFGTARDWALRQGISTALLERMERQLVAQ